MSWYDDAIERHERELMQRVRVVHPEGGEKMTKEADRPSSDINVIMSRYVQTGVLPPGGRQPTYGDFEDSGSLHENMNRLLEGQAAFMALPSRVREEFHNDLGEFVDFLHDPNTTREDFEAVGLVEAQLPEKVLAVRVVPPENGGSEPGSSSASGTSAT